MKHLNIETVGWFETLLNNRLLLKGITFAKMYDTFWQKPFYITNTGDFFTALGKRIVVGGWIYPTTFR